MLPSELSPTAPDCPEDEMLDWDDEGAYAAESAGASMDDRPSDGPPEYHCLVDRPERLDRYLAATWPNLSRSRFQKLIEAGQVTLNDRLCTNKHTDVKPGDQLGVTIPPDRPLSLEPQAIPLDILYEDSQVIVVNKPAGMVVHPAPGHADGTMVNALLAHCQTLPGMDMPSINGVQRPGVVHRLDRDTTGAIMFAKTDLANQHLQAQLRYKVAQRTYLGIVYGAPTTDRGTVDLPIGRHPVDRKKQAIVAIEKGGRKAITHWYLEERLGNYSLLRFELQTGRTHQIRVHSAELGHPIVGDPIYGSGRNVGVKLPGQALHAWKLRFQHPLNYEWIDTEAPIPEHFQTLLEVLRRRAGVL